MTDPLDMEFQVLSNGTYRSIEHRAMVNAGNERISLAMFFNPRLDAEIGPVDSLLNPKNPVPLFRRFTMDQYVKGFFSCPMEGKSYLDRLRNIVDGDEGKQT